MPDDTHDGTHTRESTRDTFRPPVRDYHTKHERDDHAPNQALHDALKAAFDTAEDADRVTLNLMASHAPGEKPNGPAPTYEVWVESRNEGMGHPAIPEPVRRLVDRNDAKITGVVECSDDHLVVSLRPIEARVEPVEVDVASIPDRHRGVPEDTIAAVLGDVDTRLHQELKSVSPLRVFRDVVRDYEHALPEPDRDGADDRLQSLDARLEDFPNGWRDEGEVGPVDTDRFAEHEAVEHNAAVTLRTVVDEHGVESTRAGEAARSLATVLQSTFPDRYAEFVDEPEAAPRAAYRQLWRRAGVDPETNDVTNLRPTGDGGYDWEGPEDDRIDPDEFVDLTDFRDTVTHEDIDDRDDAIDAARHLLHSDPYAGLPYHEVGDFPMTRPPVEPIREWVEDHRHVFLADKGDPEDVAETIADAIENFVVTGKVDPDRVDTYDDGASQEDVEDAVDDTGADE